MWQPVSLFPISISWYVFRLLSLGPFIFLNTFLFFLNWHFIWGVCWHLSLKLLLNSNLLARTFESIDFSNTTWWMQVHSHAVLWISALAVKVQCQILWWPLQCSYHWNFSQGSCIILQWQSLLQLLCQLFRDSLTSMNFTIFGKSTSLTSLPALEPSSGCCLLQWRSVF